MCHLCTPISSCTTIRYTRVHICAFSEQPARLIKRGRVSSNFLSPFGSFVIVVGTWWISSHTTLLSFVHDELIRRQIQRVVCYGYRSIYEPLPHPSLCGIVRIRKKNCQHLPFLCSGVTFFFTVRFLSFFFFHEIINV